MTDFDLLSTRQTIMRSLRAEYSKQEMRDKQIMQLTANTIKALKTISDNKPNGYSATNSNLMGQLVDSFQDYADRDEKYSSYTKKWEKQSLEVWRDILEELKNCCECECKKAESGGSSGGGGGLTKLLEEAGLAAAVYEVVKNFKSIEKAASEVETSFETAKSDLDKFANKVSDVTSDLGSTIKKFLDKVGSNLGIIPSSTSSVSAATSSSSVTPLHSAIPKNEAAFRLNAIRHAENVVGSGVTASKAFISRHPLAWEIPAALGASALGIAGLGGPDEILGGASLLGRAGMRFLPSAARVSAAGAAALGLGSMFAPAAANAETLNNLPTSMHPLMGKHTITVDKLVVKNVVPDPTKAKSSYVKSNTANSAPLGLATGSDSPFEDDLLRALGISSTSPLMKSIISPILGILNKLKESPLVSGLLSNVGKALGFNFGSSTAGVSSGTNIGANSKSTIQAIAQASKGNSGLGNILTSFAGIESSFNPNAGASSSSARGAFQITKGTAATLIDKYGKSLGITKKNYNPDNPKQQAALTAAWIKDTTALDKKSGVGTSTVDLYSQWFTGNDRMARAFKDSPNADAAAMFPTAAASNPNVFLNPDGSHRTVAQVEQFFQNRINNQPTLASAMAQTNTQVASQNPYTRSAALPTASNSYTQSNTREEGPIKQKPITPASLIGYDLTNPVPDIDSIPMHNFNPGVTMANTPSMMFR
ncbi:MAG: hypothetical protein KGH75_03845 [Rhodospirillales bacterium]|nr:hypothetical protein [Rhodospirillales bacterium]